MNSSHLHPNQNWLLKAKVFPTMDACLNESHLKALDDLVVPTQQEITFPLLQIN